MSQYTYENKLNSNIQIVIKAKSILIADELLKRVTQDSEDYKLLDKITL